MSNMKELGHAHEDGIWQGIINNLFPKNKKKLIRNILLILIVLPIAVPLCILIVVIMLPFDIVSSIKEKKEDKKYKSIEQLKYDTLLKYSPLMEKLGLCLARYLGAKNINMESEPRHRRYGGDPFGELCLLINFQTFGNGESFGIVGTEYNSIKLSVCGDSLCFFAEYYVLGMYSGQYINRKVKAELSRRISLTESQQDIEKWLVENFVDYYDRIPEVLFSKEVKKIENVNFGSV